MLEISTTAFPVVTRNRARIPKGTKRRAPPVLLDTGTLDKHHEPNTLRYHDLRRSHPVSKPWTPVDSGYVMHEIGMVQNRRQPRNRRTQGFSRPSFPCVRARGKDTPA